MDDWFRLNLGLGDGTSERRLELARRRSRAPVDQVTNNLYVAYRRCDVERILLDESTFSPDMVDDTSSTLGPLAFFNLGSAEHHASRDAIRRELNAPKLRGVVARAVSDSLASCSSTSDLVANVAEEIPSSVMANLLCLPEGTYTQFRRCAQALPRFLDSPLQSLRARHRLVAMFTTLLTQSECADLEGLGPAVKRLPLDLDRKLALLMLVSWAGTETVSAALVSLLALIGESEWTAEIHEGAADERALRYVSVLLTEELPVQCTARRVKQSIRLGAHILPTDSVVLAHLASATFETGDPRKSLAFGLGTRRCPGEALARLELREVARRLLLDLSLTITEGGIGDAIGDLVRRPPVLHGFVAARRAPV